MFEPEVGDMSLRYNSRYESLTEGNLPWVGAGDLSPRAPLVCGWCGESYSLSGKGKVLYSIPHSSPFVSPPSPLVINMKW